MTRMVMMLTRVVMIPLGLAAMLCVSPIVAADDGAAKPETTKAPAAAQAGDRQKSAPAAAVCVAREVNRSVSYRPRAGDKWRPLKVGQALLLGSDICTGLRSTCRLEFSGRTSVVLVRPVTQIRIGEFVRAGNKVRTRLYLKGGTVQADVRRGSFQSDFAVVSPEATLAVRGTRGIQMTHYQDTGTTMKLLKKGLLRVSNNKTGRGQNVRPGDKVTGNMDPPIQNVHNDSLVAVYDTHGGNTPGEIKSIKGRSQTFGGTGNQFGPGGRNWIGGFAPRSSRSKAGTAGFFRNHPGRLPNYAPPPPPPVVTPKSSSFSGSGQAYDD